MSQFTHISQDIGEQSFIPEQLAYKTIHHNTYAFERQMLQFISVGDADGLNRLFANLPALNVGKVSDDYIRQLQNIFISTTTIVSRAAIESGMDIGDSYQLSDRYIMRCEKMNDGEEIIRLQYQMIMEYANAIKEIKNGRNYSSRINRIIGYMNNNLDCKSDNETLAGLAGLSVSQLCKVFKSETGKTLNAYYTDLRILKAKKLLENHSIPLIDISTSLGFSSQSYFNRIFMRYTDLTPTQYRVKH